MRLFAFLFCTALTAWSQSGSVSQAPPVSPVREWKLPAISESALPNGMKIKILEDSRLPLASAHLVFTGGMRLDPVDRPGLATTVAETMILGTANENSSQITEHLGQVGASLTVRTGPDAIALEGRSAPDGLPLLITIMADIARQSDFPLGEVSVYSQTKRQALLRQANARGYAADQTFLQILFAPHPYSRILPPASSFQPFDPGTLKSFRTNFLTPSNTTLFVTGRLPARAILLKGIGEAFGAWHADVSPSTKPPQIPMPSRRLVLIDHPGMNSAEIRIGRLAAKPGDPDFFALVVAAILAGAPEGKNAPLMKNEIQSLDEGSFYRVIASAPADQAGERIEEIENRLNALADASINAARLSEAKTSANSSFLFKLQTQTGLLEELSSAQVLHLPSDFIEHYTANVNAVTAEQVQAAAKKYFTARDCAIVIEGEATRIEPRLAGLGSFELMKAK